MTDLNHEEPEIEATQTESKPEYTIGSLLQSARQEKGLSIDQVAKSLNLRVALINEIEADDFSNTASTTYAKGYIKNYARLVCADPFLIKECIEFQLSVDKSPTMQSFSRKTTREATDNRLTWITYLIVIVLLGMFVFWWAQKSSFFSELTDLSKPSQEEQQRLPEANNDKILTADKETDSTADDTFITSSTIPTMDIPSDKQVNDTLPQAQVAAVEDKQPLDIDAKANVSSTASDNEAPVETSSESNTSSNTPALTEINLQLTENCWIKIEDATGKVLILGEKKAGYNKTVSGTAPFKAILGAPKAVKLSLNSENVDLSYLPKSRVARLTLPLEN